MCHPNTHNKKARMAVLISDAVDFGAKNITRNKQGHFLTGSIDQKYTIILNVY